MRVRGECLLSILNMLEPWVLSPAQQKLGSGTCKFKADLRFLRPCLERQNSIPVTWLLLIQLIHAIQL